MEVKTANFIRWDPIRDRTTIYDVMDRVFVDLLSRSPVNIERYGAIDINMFHS